METLLRDTTEITRAAGAVIMEYYHSSFDVRDKKPDNPVTDADYAADNLLKERLRARLPQAGWLSEETVDNPQRLQKEYVWVVDPLDGTKEFVMGIPEFTVSVALVQNGQPLLGVIHNPATNETYTALRGEGTRYNGQVARSSSHNDLEGAVVDASRSEWKRGEFEPFKQLVQVNVMGSIAYKLARVAAGQADATWSRGPKSEWDICAGVLLVQEAGGRCVSLSDQTFTFNQSRPKVSGIIADNGHLHSAVLAALSPHGAARLE